MPTNYWQSISGTWPRRARASRTLAIGNNETILPSQVSRAQEARIINTLNQLTTPEELVSLAEIVNEVDVGAGIGRRILERREELGRFRSIQEIADIPYIGPERFSEIVITLGAGERQEFDYRRFLIPKIDSLAKKALADDFTRVDFRIVTGLPSTLALSGDISLLLVVATGEAKRWQDADQDEVLSHSDWDTALVESRETSVIPEIESNQLLRSFLLVKRGRDIVASLPLVAGFTRIIPMGTSTSDDALNVETSNANATAIKPQLEIKILAWALYAGNLRGSGDFGSQLSVAWRRVDEAAETFSPPGIHPYLKRRKSADLGEE